MECRDNPPVSDVSQKRDKRSRFCETSLTAFTMADLFDQLLTLLHPDRLLRDRGATGAGVRVAVIDGGVERAALEAKFPAQGVPTRPIEGGVFLPAPPEPLPYTGRQS